MKCCIIGLGVFGKNLARDLAQLGADVLTIDRRDDNIAQIKDEVGAAVVMDFDDPTPLAHFPISEMDAVIVAIGDDFEHSMALTMKSQELGAKRIVCRVLSPMHERLLRLLKVDRLVVPEEVAARGLAHSLLMRGVLDGFDMGNNHSIIEATVPAKLVGKSLTESAEDFKVAGVRIVTIKRVEKGLLDGLRKISDQSVKRRTLGVVTMSEIFQADDIFVLFGPEKNLRSFLETYSGD
ncbi:trk system potassium uptake protein TrkA [Ereboglobus sp. PH5-5]|uniref:potassium channel family protein n=1 Tax=unclassified Ereboglobus TaxID=2626932 RepID=UPI002404A28C|nr:MULTISPECIES: TrkA family potassium uptake protein [unclassified Ereboglobus]MDF9827784.1 trk system potassium uptake protein TrkA [Ereboglobus sp. PH5-10]MDF9834380.1 trk system potassium uptake protein TrkA [Ereboglobus sp. PH5-5]